MLIESGGDNLSATFSPELADITLYVIDVAGGDKVPRKGGPGITRSDLLIINKIDLAPYVGASLEVMDRDARKMRGDNVYQSEGRHRAGRCVFIYCPGRHVVIHHADGNNVPLISLLGAA